MRISVERSGAIARVGLEGKFDFSGRRKIKRVRDELVAEPDIREIEFDLSRVTQIDSAALGMLLLVRDATDASDKRLTLTSAVGRVREILEVANFEAMMSDRPHADPVPPQA